MLGSNWLDVGDEIYSIHILLFVVNYFSIQCFFNMVYLIFNLLIVQTNHFIAILLINTYYETQNLMNISAASLRMDQRHVKVKSMYVCLCFHSIQIGRCVNALWYYTITHPLSYILSNLWSIHFIFVFNPTKIGSSTIIGSITSSRRDERTSTIPRGTR